MQIFLRSACCRIADGIAVLQAGKRTLPMVKRYVDEIVLVDEEKIANATLFLLEREKVAQWAILAGLRST